MKVLVVVETAPLAARARYAVHVAEAPFPPAPVGEVRARIPNDVGVGAPHGSRLPVNPSATLPWSSTQGDERAPRYLDPSRRGRPSTVTWK